MPVTRKTSEQTFFEDEALDRAFGVVMALATEVQVLRDRLGALEARLATAGLVETGDLAAAPGDEERAAGEADRRAFATALLEPLLGRQSSKSVG